MAMEAAKNRARKRDAALMERAFRQVTARQRASRLVKARYVCISRNTSDVRWYYDTVGGYSTLSIDRALHAKRSNTFGLRWYCKRAFGVQHR